LRKLAGSICGVVVIGHRAADVMAFLFLFGYWKYPLGTLVLQLVGVVRN
jgi:hypothetical protein